MPKPVKRVSEVRPRQAVFAASIKQFPKRLVILTEGDSWFGYPLNANIADYIGMMDDFSILRLHELARYLVDELHARLTALSAARPGFHLVDMRACLPVDATHWADETHPSGTGFRRLAEDGWRPAPRASVPGRGFE